MPRCGATLMKYHPPWLRGTSRVGGPGLAFPNPSRQPPEGFMTAVVLTTAVVFPLL